MNKTLQYKGYFTKVCADYDDEIFHGKIEGISDLVTYESDDFKGIEAAFHKAVDDYLSFCEANKKAPDVPFKGTFNVRIAPDLHRNAVMEAMRTGISLNQFVGDAIRERLDGRSVQVDTTSIRNAVSEAIKEQNEISWGNIKFDAFSGIAKFSRMN